MEPNVAILEKAENLFQHWALILEMLHNVQGAGSVICEVQSAETALFNPNVGSNHAWDKHGKQKSTKIGVNLMVSLNMMNESSWGHGSTTKQAILAQDVQQGWM